jgi:hypothetical protein
VPVTFSNYTALLQNSGIKISWSVTNEVNVNKYVVEKSKDAINFSEAGFITATGLANYNWIDANNISGNNYYRIKAIDKDGSFKITSVMKITQGKENTGVTVYPNPVKNGMVNLEVSALVKGVYTAQLLNSEGRTINTSTINHEGGTANYKLQLPSKLKSGLYNLVVLSNDFKVTRQIFVE